MKVKINVSNFNIIIYMARCFSTDSVIKAIRLLIENRNTILCEQGVYTQSLESNRKLVIPLSRSEIEDTSKYINQYRSMETHGHECWISFDTNADTQIVEDGKEKIHLS